MAIAVISNTAQGDPKRLGQVLQRHAWKGFDIEFDGEGRLQFVKGALWVDRGALWVEQPVPEEPKDVRDSVGETFPLAVKRDKLQECEQESDSVLRRLLVSNLWLQEGTKGFHSLLKDLATALQTSFVVLTLVWRKEEGQVGAEVWCVHPGNTDVHRIWIEFAGEMTQQLIMRTLHLTYEGRVSLPVQKGVFLSQDTYEPN